MKITRRQLRQIIKEIAIASSSGMDQTVTGQSSSTTQTQQGSKLAALTQKLNQDRGTAPATAVDRNEEEEDIRATEKEKEAEADVIGEHLITDDEIASIIKNSLF